MAESTKRSKLTKDVDAPTTPTASRAKSKKSKAVGVEPQVGATRDRIMAVALDLFQSKGVAESTMREIAKNAGLSLGAAYHHFESKDAIVFEHFLRTIEEQNRRALARMEKTRDFRERVEVALWSGLEIRLNDKKLMAALARIVIDPENPNSIFSTRSQMLRSKAEGIFRLAVEVDEVPEASRPLLASALWALQLGLVLKMLYDDSPGNRDTRAILDGVLDLLPGIVLASTFPIVDSFREPVENILRIAGWKPPELTTKTES